MSFNAKDMTQGGQIASMRTGRKTERNVWRWSPACWLLFRRLTLPPVMQRRWPVL